MALSSWPTPDLIGGRAATYTPCAMDRAEVWVPGFAGTTKNMIDPNNRPGGPNLILTAKSANKIQFFDAATLAKTAEIDMPASTHEMIRSPDGGKVYASVYGGGIFGQNKNPDRRIAVIDLAAKKLERTIDIGDNLAPHSVMMDARGTLWSTAELGNAVLAIDPGNDRVERIDARRRAALDRGQSLNRQTVRLVQDQGSGRGCRHRRAPHDRKIAIPHGAEGIAVSPDGWALYVCAHRKGVLHAFDTRTLARHHTATIDGAPGEANQLRRVRVSPDGRYVCASSHVDNYAAVYDAFSLDRSPASRRRRRRWASVSPPTASSLSVLPRRRHNA